MDKIIIKFGDTEIEKHKFDQHKSPISVYNIDTNKIVLMKPLLAKKILNNWLQRC